MNPAMTPAGCYNPSQRGSISDRKCALSHRKCQLKTDYLSKDPSLLHFVYYYVGYFFFPCFDFFGFICNLI